MCLPVEGEIEPSGNPRAPDPHQANRGGRVRVIDMNVPKYLENGHGGNIIQGSVSLDDESAEGCTEILPGFHHHIGKWWRAVEERLILAGIFLQTRKALAQIS